MGELQLELPVSEDSIYNELIKTNLADRRIVFNKEVDSSLIEDVVLYILKWNQEDKYLTVEDIQDLVENGLMSTKRKDVARAYITYRNKRTEARGNITDNTIEELLSGTNEYWSKENSNKNPKKQKPPIKP